MDYLNQGTAFKIRKVLRYVAMYGIGRTRIKIMSQLHLRKRFREYPDRGFPALPSQQVGLIGCGNFCFSNIAYYLNKEFGAVIRACMDADPDKAYSLAGFYKVPGFHREAEGVLSDPSVRLVYIASNHATHAEYAIRALYAGKSVYIEKPHVVNEGQLIRLVEAMRATQGRVFIGFNRPASGFGKVILRSLRSEPGPGMYNWCVIGHPIDAGHWYMRPEEGGRVLGNLCHWMDFTLRMIDARAFPVRITPTRAENGDHDMAVTYTFADGSIAAITFSAKGDTFDGVRERLSAHRGDCIIYMDDYKTMTVDVKEKRRRYRNPLRDLGHRRGICDAFAAVRDGGSYDREAMIEYVANAGWLFLKTKEAFDRNRSLIVHGFTERDRDKFEEIDAAVAG